MITEDYVEILCNKIDMHSVIEKIFPECLERANKNGGTVNSLYAEIGKDFPSFSGNLRTLLTEICNDDVYLSFQQRIVSNFKGLLMSVNTGIV
jgi:hypothetical protein